MWTVTVSPWSSTTERSSLGALVRRLGLASAPTRGGAVSSEGGASACARATWADSRSERIRERRMGFLQEGFRAVLPQSLLAEPRGDPGRDFGNDGVPLRLVHQV